MTLRGAGPIAWRVLLGLRGDRRTLGLVVVVPVVITWLFGAIFDSPEFAAPALLGVFVFFLTYILTAIGFLRERTAGTLERLLVSPISRSGLVVGYLVGYGYLAVVQSIVLGFAGVFFLSVEFEHGVWLFLLLELFGAFTALGTGIVLSLLAQNEFQVMQFIPAVITPQVILGGAFVPLDDMPDYLAFVGRLLPVTYLIDGMDYVILDNGSTGDYWTAIGVLALYTVTLIALTALGVRRAA
ncbi:MAG: ABC transporter permease [Haloferacaceae archaeon]